MRALFKHLLIAMTGLIAVGTSALAQDYPNRTVRILVGYPPGSAPDLAARTIGQSLSQTFGQPFVPENKAGAGGTIATDLVAKSPADGYTLLLGETGQLEIAPYLFKALPYDTLRDFAPISTFYSTPLIFVSNPNTQIRTIKDLVREAKANPGKLNFGSSGIGSIHHIIFEAFNAAAGVKITHIPFKGSTQTIPALLSGEVHVIPGSLSVVSAQVRAGTVNPLGVTSIDRYPFAPDVPPIAEEIKGFDFSSELGLLAPAGLAPDSLAKLSRAMKVAIDAPSLRDQYKNLGVVFAWSTPESYREKIRQNLKKYEQVIRSANIQAN